MTIVPLARRRVRSVLASLLLACGLALAGGAPDVDGLRPGEFAWTPELAPSGPVVVVVSLPAQRAWVYRNGVRIGASTVSTGRAGHETPTGVFTILQKAREHYSNLYASAPMPYMQRLTWDGIALHAGHLPGYPASHGCIRLPPAFAAHLFEATRLQTTVVVTDAAPAPASIVAGPFALASATRTQDAPGALPATVDWAPERAPDGPLTLLLSTRDGQLLALRNGVEIGRTPVSVDPGLRIGTQVYALLEGRLAAPSVAGAGRPALPWHRVDTGAAAVAATPDLRAAVADGRLVIPMAFARAVYDALVPGTTFIVTDESLDTSADDSARN